MRVLALIARLCAGFAFVSSIIILPTKADAALAQPQLQLALYLMLVTIFLALVARDLED